MYLKRYIKIMTISLICLISSHPSAEAQWPTTDINSIVGGIQAYVQKVDQYKTQILESKAVTSINSAIGDAKASMSKFNLDQVEEAKRKADKVKKAKEKLDNAKEKINKAKKEYEEKKAQFDEYKQKIEDAKREVKEQLDDAKEMYGDVKDMAEGAGSLAQQGAKDLKEKTSSVTGGRSDKNSNSENTTPSPSTSSAPTVRGRTEFLQPTDEPISPSAGSKNNILSPNTNATLPEAGNDRMDKAPAESILAPSIQDRVSMPADLNTQQKLSGGNTSPSAVNTTLRGADNNRTNVISAEEGLSQTPEPAETDVLAPRENSLSPEIEGEDNEFEEIELIEGEPNDNETINPVARARLKASEDGSTEGVKTLNQGLREAVRNGDTEALNAISQMDEAEVINSNSKIYDNSPSTVNGRQKFTMPTVEDEVKEAPITKEPEKSPSTNSTIKNSLEKGQVDKKNTESFRKESSLFNDGDYVRQSSIKISARETLTFADVSGCKEYSNAIQSGDDGEIVIISETLAKECCIKAEQLTDMNIIKDCANKILIRMHDDDATVAEEAQGAYSVITAEQNIYGLTEAWKDKTDSSSYFANVLKDYIEDSDKTRKEGSSNEGISSIALTNIQSLYILNRIPRIYTTSLVNTAVGNIGTVKKETLSEDTDIGLAEIKGDYNYSVTRGLHDNVKSSDEASVEYPVIPENIAKKCLITLKADNMQKVKECYYQIVKEANDKDFTQAAIGKNFIESIKYQDMINILQKSLYQKVKTAKYDEELEKTKNNVMEGTDERTNFDALFKTDTEMHKAIDELIHIYAARIATTSLENIGQLSPKTENTEKTEG